jgi:hypothetical protein
VPVTNLRQLDDPALSWDTRLMYTSLTAMPACVAKWFAVCGLSPVSGSGEIPVGSVHNSVAEASEAYYLSRE